LAKVLRPEHRVLDVGCSDGRGSARLTGVDGCDIYRPSLARAAAQARRVNLVQTDVRRLPYATGSFDVTVALDVIEHFQKPDALQVVAEMERVSRWLVVLLTPVGFVEQPGTSEEPWQEHRCGFDPEELERLGYQTVGVGGLARLRGQYGAFRWGPPGAALAAATQPLVRSRPDRAFHVAGIKRVA
jgi:SAM-dependent methyltransferase